MINSSTGFSSFQLWMGYSLKVIPPLSKDLDTTLAESPRELLEQVANNASEAQDNLLEVKVLHADQANKHCREAFPFTIGDHVMLSTKNQLKEVQGLTGSKIVQKLAPKFNGPFMITGVDDVHNMVTLNIPGPVNKCKMFHVSQVK